MTPDLITEWAERSARLEYDFGLDRARAELEASVRIPALLIAVKRHSLIEVREALLLAERGDCRRLEALLRTNKQGNNQ